MSIGTSKGRRRIGWLISAVAIAALTLYVDWAELAAAFSRADPVPVVTASVFLLACYLAFALRWRTLLTDRTVLPLGPVFAALMTGYMANLLFPLRPGDILRGLLIDRQFGYGKVKALTSVGLERLFDLGTLCVFGLASLALVPRVAGLREILGTTLALVAVAVLGLTALIVLGGPTPRSRGLDASLRDKARAAIGRLREALRELAGDSQRIGRRVLSVIGLSVLGWACFAAAMVACVSAFSSQTPYEAGLVLTVVTNLGAAIPSSPAGVGVYHALAVMTLAAFGIGAGDALAIAIVSHALAVATQAGLGAGALAWAGTKGWRALREARELGTDEPRP